MQSVFATILGAAGVVFLRKFSASFRAADRIASRVSEHFPDGGSLEQFALTVREFEILDGISRGVVSDVEIAEEFSIAPTAADVWCTNW